MRATQKITHKLKHLASYGHNKRIVFHVTFNAVCKSVLFAQRLHKARWRLVKRSSRKYGTCNLLDLFPPGCKSRIIADQLVWIFEIFDCGNPLARPHRNIWWRDRWWYCLSVFWDFWLIKFKVELLSILKLKQFIL